MDFFTRFSLRNAAVVVLVTLLVTAGGAYSAGQLKRETMPDVAIPIVAIVTVYPGAAPADVADKVTEPLEEAITGVVGLESLTSVSNDSVSIVVAQFDFSADMEKAESEIQDVIGGVELPDTVIAPATNRVSMGSQPMLRFAVVGTGSSEELQAAARDVLLPVIESVDGVGEVQVATDYDESVRIVFDPDALDEHGIGERDVIQQLQAANISFPVGTVELDSIDNPIRVQGGFDSVEDLRAFEVALYPDMNATFADAFAAIGEGMGMLGGAVARVGGAVGQLGQGMGDLGSAVGEIGAGMGRLGEGLGMQMGLSAALQDLQARTLDAKIQLESARSVMRDLESAGATATAEYAAAQAAALQLEQVVPALEEAAGSVKAQLLEAQKAAAASSPPSMPATPSGAPARPSMPAAASMPSAEMGEPSIGLVALDDIADITYGIEEGAVYSRADGRPAVLVNVVKTQDANTVDVAAGVKAAADEGLGRMPAGTEVVYTYDGSEMIQSSISDMVQEGLLGALFAFLVILVFLRNWRSTLISAISIPLSVVVALLFMRFAGITMNVMTLGGLTVAIGRVVDDSIVVIENVFNHLQAGSERTPDMVRKATAEVSTAITSSTLTTVAVFAPMMLVSGIVGRVFTPFAITVALALLASLLVAVTIVPLLAKWFLLGTKVTARDERTTRAGRTYRRALAWSLDHPGAVVTVAAFLLAGSLALVPMMGAGFMPPATEKFISVNVEYPAGFTRADVDEALRTLEEALADDPEVGFHTGSVKISSGFDMADGGVSAGNRGEVFVSLTEDADVNEALARIQAAAAPIEAEGGKITASQVSMAGGSDSSIEIVVTGPDIVQIERSAAAVMTALQGVEGLANVSTNLAQKRPQITADVDQAAAASHGLNAAMVAGAIRGYVAEQAAGSIEIGGRDAPIVYITALKDVDSAQDIAARKLATPLGDEVAIGDVADVRQEDTPMSILRRDEREYAAVTGSVTDRDTSSVISAVEERIAALDLPDGVEVEMEGVASMMSESFRQLGLAMLVAVAAVYLVMMLAFGEAIAPLAIMFSLPLAIIGGVLALFLSGLPLDMPGMIGALMLIGIVTTNAIMLIERVNQNLAAGSSRREALLDAGTNRMRPIMMTALTTVCALLPMASGLKPGALMSQTLALVVVGGLTTSTMLTLVVVPVVYDLLQSLKERVLGFGRSAAARSDAA